MRDLYRFLRIGLLVTLALVALAIEMAPLGLSAGATPSPDLVFCVVAVFAIRRPGSAPMLVVFLVGLGRDLVSDTPPGLGAISLTLAAEAMKTRGPRLERQSFIAEWLTVGAAATAMLALQWASVLLTFARPPYLVDLAHQALVTLACYPAMVLLIRWMFGVGWRKMAAS